ncbi:hypothetical protein KR222_002530, partial [Zaprionus bogoriensis]
MKIIQINLNHCETAHELLTQTMRDLNADVALISEPYKRTAGPAYLLDATKSAAILTAGLTGPEKQRIGSYYIRAKVMDLILYSCYLPPRLSLPEFAAVLDEIVNDARGKPNVIIAGDFNAWATEWGSPRSNGRGRTLLESFASLDIALLNTGSEHTYSRAGAGSVVDLTFCSSSLFQRAAWRLSEIYTASDHKAIICDIALIRRTPGAQMLKRFNPKTLQTEVFLRELRCPETGEHAERSVECIMSTIKTACRASMKETKSHHRHLEPVYWWTEEIADARRDCLRARRLHQRAHGRPSLEGMRQEYAEKRRTLKR